MKVKSGVVGVKKNKNNLKTKTKKNGHEKNQKKVNLPAKSNKPKKSPKVNEKVKGGANMGKKKGQTKPKAFTQEAEAEEFQFDDLNQSLHDDDTDMEVEAERNPVDAHNQLLESVDSVLSSKLPPESRPRGIVSGISSKKGTLTMESLLETFKKVDEKLYEATVKGLGKEIKSKPKPLSTPLTKPVSEKLKRTILYEKVKTDVGKWDSIVQHNRLADQLIFPLSSETEKKSSKPTIKEVTAEFVPETPLEEEIARILHGEEFIRKRREALLGKEPEKSEAEKYALSIEEALEQHHELAKLRALHSYEAAKAKRKNKIKSKKYHRLIRREKIKKQMKDFEELQKTNPVAAMEKLEELERARVQERMSLKHRNTTKWAKMHAARAKYSRESRAALSDQLKISHDLTVKRIDSSDEEEEDEPDTSMPVLVQSSVANPSQTLINIRNHLNIGGAVRFDMKATQSELDSIEDDDEDDEQRNLIAEAFEDDDVISSFQKKKQEEIDKEKPSDTNLTLPGWGEWGGSNLKVSEKKRKQFLIKAKPAPPRKDSKLPHVILNSDANVKLKEHQVRELPFPFTRVKDFEKMVRAPVGRTWIPEQSMKSLITPKVITRLGAVIQPISEEMLANKPESSNKLTGLNIRSEKKV